MYNPAPPRPKKTNIVRSRNGCRTCRERKTKCDEKKPAYGTCVRLGKPCVSVQPELKFRHVAVPAAVRRDIATTVRELEQDKTRRRPAEDHEKDTGAVGCLGSLDLIRSLQHVERDVCYTTYWEDRCLPAMHPIFLTMSSVADRPSQSMLRDSILALSSRQFSRQQVERKTSSASHMGSFSPSLSHQTRSHLYYSAAITKMSRISQQTVSADTTVVVAVLTLFAYIEASVGNFEGFRCHVNGMLQLLESHPEILNDPVNKALILAWMQIRFVNWWSRAYFSSLDVHCRLPPVPLLPALEGNYDLLHNRRVLVLSILCESHRLNSCEVLRLVGTDAAMNTAEDRRPTGPDGGLEACFHALGEQERRLDDWLAHLPPSDLPIFEGQPSWDAGRLEDPRLPIYFESHDAALNYAYYALCRVMQCRGLLRSLQCRSPQSDTYRFEEEEGWIWLLLRIVKGTSFQTSLARNNYTIGFQGLLLAALLRCQSPVLAAEIQSWVQTLADLQPTEEGAFPIYQTLGVIKAINSQKQVGIDVVGVTQPIDDGGGTPKLTAFNSQPIDRVVFHGRSRTTGLLVAKCVPIET
ncbi:hypothetical protein BDW67DRAFT_192417 [Aspergillus spinulosporus]